MTSNYALVKKISGKVLFPRGIEAPPVGETVPLYEIIGRASGYRTGETNNGPYVALLGAFQAKRFADGQVFRSGIYFPPGMLVELIQASLQEHVSEPIEERGQNRVTQLYRLEQGVSATEFAFIVNVVGNTTSPVKYEWGAKPLLPLATDDPLTELMQRASTSQLAHIDNED